MKFGYNLLLWTRHVTDDVYAACAALKAAGYDGVEVPVFQGSPAYYRQVGQRLRDLGLGVTVLGMLPDVAKNPLSPDADERRAALDHQKWLVECAAALGAEVLGGPVNQPIGYVTGQGPTAEEYALMVANQREMAVLAGSAGLRLAVEPLNRFEGYALTTNAQAARLVRDVGQANYGTLCDTFHANIEENDVVGAIAATVGQITHMHLSENHRGLLGSGHIDFPGVIRTLKAGGYTGWLTVESFGNLRADITAAVRIWRPMMASDAEAYETALDVMRRGVAAA